VEHCDSPHLRGKIDGFLRDGNMAVLNRDTWVTTSRCDICVQNVGPSQGLLGQLGPAGQLRRLTQTICFPGAGLTYPHLDKTLGRYRKGAFHESQHA
jgi:hypothetical protein